MIPRYATAACAVVAAVVLCGQTAHAQKQRPRGALGLGLSLGDPTGITAEYYPQQPGFGHAIELTLGLDTFDDGNVYAHLQWKFYLAELARGRSVEVPLYAGIGPWLAEGGDDIILGARAPFGVAFEFRTAPLQLFFELALYLTVINGDEGDLDLGGAVGFRFFF